MTKTSSEYEFPIFISSTDYNLIDLRAELARYLSDLGYKPVLSSNEGFHDNSPYLEPWESCLQVLQTTFVMVLVIDGKYGKCLEWKNVKSIIGDRKVSPTHAEYICAHETKMRMLVFIREEVLTFYQSYHQTMKIAGGDKKLAKENLSKTLPPHIEFETLEFIEEVKTTRPIPWIKAFANVNDIKHEIQKKMLNELAELFLFKSQHLATVIKSFSTALDGLSKEKRKEILENIGSTKELISEIENQTEMISGLKKDKDKIEDDFKHVTSELAKAKKEKSKDEEKLKSKAIKLTEDLKTVDGKITLHELKNANYLITGSTLPFLTNDSLLGISNILGGNSSLFSTSILGKVNTSPLSPVFGTSSVYAVPQTCDKCHLNTLTTTSIAFGSSKTCPSCNRRLCSRCFNCLGVATGTSYSSECADCRNNNAATMFGTKK